MPGIRGCTCILKAFRAFAHFVGTSAGGAPSLIRESAVRTDPRIGASVSTTFAALGVPAELTRLLADNGITTPFPIQSATIADALAGHDVCGKAPTGSGKTLAFGVALAMRATYSRPKTPSALVLVPTRELADQVAKEISPLVGARGGRTAVVYGGASYVPQRKALGRGVNVVVATPGRLEDLIAQGDVRLNKVQIVVLDEADRMADMGFMPAVKRILDDVPDDRQTLLFSATLDGDVDELVRKYQRNPRHHESAGVDDAGEVDHHFWNAPREIRIQLTARIVSAHYRAIVFCRTRRGADRLARQLGAAGVKSAAIHGDLSQAQRERALQAFKDDKVACLVATDVAARGIHVDDVPCVVHFDPPADAKDYVHRSGRTGRAGNHGKVFTLVDGATRKTVKAIQRELGVPQRVDEPDIEIAAAIRRETPVAPDNRPPVSDRASAEGNRRARRAHLQPKSGKPAARGKPALKPGPSGRPVAKKPGHWRGSDQRNRSGPPRRRSA